jgi:hypothetical protein
MSNAQMALQVSVVAAPNAPSKNILAKSESPEFSPYHTAHTPIVMARVIKAVYTP